MSKRLGIILLFVVLPGVLNLFIAQPANQFIGAFMLGMAWACFLYEVR